MEPLRNLLKEKALVYQRDEEIVRADGSRPTWLFDFRRVLLDARVLREVAREFWELLEDRYPFQVGGMESAAIPLIAAIVLEGAARGTPVSGFYVRKSRKKQGLLKQIEGSPSDESVVLIDDLINSGGSFRKQIAILKEQQLRVTDIFTIVRFRDPDAYPFLAEDGIRLQGMYTLTDFGLHDTKRKTPRYDRFDAVWRFEGTSPDLHRVSRGVAPVLDEKYIYIPTDEGALHAVRQESGDISWHTRFGITKRRTNHITGIAMHRDTLFVSTVGGVTRALSTADGGLRWQFSNADRTLAPPLLIPETHSLFVPINRGWFLDRDALVCLDTASGSEQWSSPLPAPSRITPITGTDNAVIVGCSDGTVQQVRTSDGKTLWTTVLDAAIAGLCLHAGEVLVTTESGAVFVLTPTTGEVLRTRTPGGPIHTRPLSVGTLIIVSSLDSYVYALRRDTLDPVWAFETQGRIFADPVAIQESVYVGSNDGRLYELDPTNGKALSETQVTERITTPFMHCATTGYYFLTTQANQVYCFREKEPGDASE